MEHLAVLAFIALLWGVPILLVSVAFVGLRALARWVWRDKRKLWHVKAATVSAILGFCAFLLAFAAYSSSDTVKRQFQKSVGFMNSWRNPEYIDGFPAIVGLSKTLWLWENFPAFVLMPAGLILFVGYALDRSRRDQKSLKS